MERKATESLSSILTPNEIKNQEFKRTAWGYSPKEVIEYLEKTAKAWEKVQKNEKDLLAKIESLHNEIKDWQGRENQILKIHEKALRDAEQIKLEAVEQAEKVFEEVEKKSNEIRLQTEAWLENIIGEIEETQRQKDNFLIALKSSLDSHYALLDKERVSDPLGVKLSQFLKAKDQRKQEGSGADTPLI